MWIFIGVFMENNKDIGWYLDMDSDAFSFSMDTTDGGIVLLPLAGIVLQGRISDTH